MNAENQPNIPPIQTKETTQLKLKKGVPKSKDEAIKEELQPNPTTPIDQNSIKKLANKAKDVLSIPDFIHKTLASISIFVPFIFLTIGASLQINSLNSIGKSYIRFFSYSQLLSDSLFFFSIIISKTFPFFLGFLYSFVSNYLRNLIVPNVKLSELDDEKLALILFELISEVLIIMVLLKQFYSSPEELKNVYALATFGYSISFFYRIFFKRKKRKKTNLEENGFENLKYKEGCAIMILLFLILGFGAFIYNSTIFFNSIYDGYKETQNSNLPNNTNFIKLHNRYKTQNIQYNLLYFNDQYIFIGLDKDTTIAYNKNINLAFPVRKIEILRFEELFKPEEK
ncbi:hypothetical protein [Emticicia sp. SJ17W-69]|uniref:hypothetical protein n=1 Tax=Emticicia sp. SJ17W-69 TaxID=3421657 RepID=UPI003EC04F33